MLSPYSECITSPRTLAALMEAMRNKLHERSLSRQTEIPQRRSLIAMLEQEITSLDESVTR